jgi:hypothetical protein
VKSPWRLLLIWLMVLALPVQGLAAAGLMHCAPIHERVDGQGHHGDAAHAHVDHAAHDGHAADAIDHAAHGHTCSACAACCPAIGLPAHGVDLPSAPVGGFAAGAAQSAGPSFVPAGLERPPRA